MATLAPGGRNTTAVVEDEITRLRESWATPEAERSEGLVERFLTADRIAQLDRSFDMETNFCRGTKVP